MAEAEVAETETGWGWNGNFSSLQWREYYLQNWYHRHLGGNYTISNVNCKVVLIPNTCSVILNLLVSHLMCEFAKTKQAENTISGFPLGLENLEKMGRHFPVREKSGNFEQTGKVRENHTKYWKTPGIWDKYYLIFLVMFKWTVYYLLKWIKFSIKKQNNKKILEKWQKILESQGKVSEFCQSGKVGTLDFLLEGIPSE